MSNVYKDTDGRFTPISYTGTTMRRLPDDFAEAFDQGTDEQKAELLCMITEMAGIDCNKCPVSEYCCQGHTGYMKLFEGKVS